jgi:predicted RNA-binding Zn-ribbon protein involved in translation (DUF1610 family)
MEKKKVDKWKFAKSNVSLYLCGSVTKNVILDQPTKNDQCGILIYDPNTNFKCPKCLQQMMKTGQFCDGSNLASPPRLLYNTGRNVWLVSRLWSCSKCGMWKAHNSNLLLQSQEDYPFLLYSRSGITQELHALLINSIAGGENSIFVSRLHFKSWALEKSYSSPRLVGSLHFLLAVGWQPFSLKIISAKILSAKIISAKMLSGSNGVKPGSAQA